MPHKNRERIDQKEKNFDAENAFLVRENFEAHTMMIFRLDLLIDKIVNSN